MYFPFPHLTKTWQLTTLTPRAFAHLWGKSGVHSDMGVKKYEAYFGSAMIPTPSSQFASFKMPFFNKTHGLPDFNSCQTACRWAGSSQLSFATKPTCNTAPSLLSKTLWQNNSFNSPDFSLASSLPRKLPLAQELLKMFFTISHNYCFWQSVSEFPCTNIFHHWGKPEQKRKNKAR